MVVNLVCGREGRLFTGSAESHRTIRISSEAKAIVAKMVEVLTDLEAFFGEAKRVLLEQRDAYSGWTFATTC